MLRRRLCLHVFVLPSLELRTTLQFLRQLSLVGEKVKGCFHALHGLETRLCWACFHFLWSFCSDGPVDVRAVVIFVGSVFSDTLLHYVKKQVPSCLFCPVIARLLCAGVSVSSALRSCMVLLRLSFCEKIRKACCQRFTNCRRKFRSQTSDNMDR